MKFVYATLAGSAMAAQPIMDFIESQLDDVYQETYDGFKINAAPYLLADVSNFGATGKVQYSLDGQNMNVDNWQVSESSVRGWGVAYGSNAVELGFPAGEIIETANYDETCKWSASGAGAKISCDREAEFSFTNGQTGSLEEDFSVEASLETMGNSVSLDIAIDGEMTNDNLDIINSYGLPLWYLVRPYTLDLDSSIKINNVDLCSDLAPGCSISIESSIDAPADDFSGDVKLSFDLKKFAAVFKMSGSDVDSGMFFVRKVNKADRGMPLDGDMGWVSVHVAAGDNWQTAVRSNSDILVLRFPMPAQWAQDALPELEVLAAPFIEFGQTAMMNMEKLPYVLYYLDNFFATFDNEFDCSKYVRAVNVESDLLAELVGASSFNDFMAEGCQELNADIVEALQCPELDAGMDAMREYVSEMNSAAGEQEFNQLFGGIF